MAAIIYDVELGKEDGSSRTIRTQAADEASARKAAETFLQEGETVIFVEAAEVEELEREGLGDHPEEGPALELSPQPKARDLS